MDSVKSGIKKPGSETTGSGQNHSSQNQLLQGCAHFSSRAVTPTNGSVSTNSGTTLKSRKRPLTDDSVTQSLLQKVARMELSTITANSAAPKQRCVSHYKKQVLSDYLRIPMEDITEEKLVALLKKPTHYNNRTHILEYADLRLLKKLLTPDYIKKFSLRVNEVPESVLSQLSYDQIIDNIQKCEYSWYPSDLPTSFFNREFIQRCLDKHVFDVLRFLPENDNLHNLRIDYTALAEKKPQLFIRNFSINLQDQVSTLWLSTLQKDPSLIEYVSPKHPHYEQLCLEIIATNSYLIRAIPQASLTESMLLCAEKQGFSMALGEIPAQLRTKGRCLAAMRKENFRIKDCLNLGDIGCRDSISVKQYINDPTLLEALPDDLKTEELCKAFLERHPQILKGVPPEYMEHHPGCLEAAIRRDGSNLANIPPHLITEDICRWAVEQSGNNITLVPDRFRASLLPTAARQCCLTYIPEKYRTLEVYTQVVTANPRQFVYVPEDIRSQLPPELLLAVAPEYLPLEWRLDILQQGDTSLSNTHRTVRAPRVPSEHLLKAINPLLNTEPDHSCSLLLTQQLLACQPFRLRNQQLGSKLQEHIRQHIAQRTRELIDKNLPELAAVPEHATVYGGRSILSGETGQCSRIKFLRKDESLDDFFREEAVHRFAADSTALHFHSEIPQAVGIKLLPEEKLPASLKQQFSSTLELRAIHNQRFYVLYQFTTCNSDYSRYVYQPDERGNTCQAEQGIYKVCHDLGLWNSLGAVHTSTMTIYHAINRRFLFLSSIFRGGSSPFPGAIDAWERATNESDWGYTGLRDIGDLEFYPSIQSYFSCNNISLPPGYDQRCAFINAFCENMLAAVLHYARLHKSESDYHYRNEAGLTKLRCFLEQAVNSYLSGLFGQQTTMADFFDSTETYQKWLSITAKEIALWTAPQDTSDCFARSLEQGTLPQEVYPDFIYTENRYPQNFQSSSYPGETRLGADMCPLSLIFLVKGLYQIAMGLSEKLSQPVQAHLNVAS